MSSFPPPLAQAQLPAPVLQVLTRLSERGFKAYLVGGCVRDLLLGKPAKDFDVATSARPEEVQGAFPKVIPTGIQHGTVTVLVKGVGVEVTTFRKEGAYLDGRRPSEVTFHTEIEADLSRRDFTINAMAFDPVAGVLSDPFAGQADLSAGIIRCVGDARARFGEDGLRPLRAVRFAAVLGFALEDATFAAIPETLEIFAKVSVERIREELTKLLLSSRPRLGLTLLRSTRLMERFLPEVLVGVDVLRPENAADVFTHTAATLAAVAPELELRLAALLHDVTVSAKDLCLRLRYPNKVCDQVDLLVRWSRAEPLLSATDPELRRFLAQLGPENLPAWLALVEASIRGREKEIDPALTAFHALRDRFTSLLAVNPALTPKQLALDGAAIMSALQVGPSRAIGEATRFLMDRVIEDPALNQGDRLVELLKRWWASKSA